MQISHSVRRLHTVCNKPHLRAESHPNSCGWQEFSNDLPAGIRRIVSDHTDIGLRQRNSQKHSQPRMANNRAARSPQDVHSAQPRKKSTHQEGDWHAHGYAGVQAAVANWRHKAVDRNRACGRPWYTPFAKSHHQSQYHKNYHIRDFSERADSNGESCAPGGQRGELGLAC